MEKLYDWIRNITFYLIFMTVVTSLLPDKKYEKYFKLFAGLILILLVVKPLASGLRLEDSLAYYFESISFQKEARELSKDLSGMEAKRLLKVIEQYEEAVAMDLASMAENEGFGCQMAKAVIGREEGTGQFGRVISARLVLTRNPYGENGAAGGNGGSVPGEGAGSEKNIEGPGKIRLDTGPVKGVDRVEVDLYGESKSSNPADLRQSRKKLEEENTRVVSLKRRIAEYYDLEDKDIEIQLEDEQG